MNQFETDFVLAYEEYLKSPLATINGNNKKSELYSNLWCIITGRSITHPHPHRHYNFLEFVYYCGQDEKLKKRFLKNKPMSEETKENLISLKEKLNFETPGKDKTQLETRCGASWELLTNGSLGKLRCRYCGVYVVQGGTPKCLKPNNNNY